MMTQGMRDDVRAVENSAHELLIADYVGATPEDVACILEGMAKRIAGVMAELAKECAR